MSAPPDQSSSLDLLRDALWAEYDPRRGHWPGELASSALSTAVAAFALALIDPVRHGALIRGGLDWLVTHQNADGGWGDTPDSPSNISTTVLGWAALTRAQPRTDAVARAEAAAERWLAATAGGERLDRAALTAAVVRHYGNDRTFSTPILTMCALSGRFGTGAGAWRDVFPLPFELAVLPPALFRWLHLTVVSYAVPALVAIGLVRHRLGPRGNPLTAALRDLAAPPALRLARSMQPPNGGYEEATPLTAFVAMALAAAGLRDHPIVRDAVAFLVASVRPSGAWPIDTNLSTWVTVLAVQALTQTRGPDAIPPDRRNAIRGWLLAQQQAERHPLTFGGRGGWGWSDQPGSMPDADDTSGVLVALRRLGGIDARVTAAATRGIGWLLSLQNTDGGIPTFSRGWGRLPFDRSCPDITAHAIRAFAEWHDAMPPTLQRRMRAATRRAVAYLVRAQRADGAWVPLWFGNQYDPALENPVYGSAQVIIALAEAVARLDALHPAMARAAAYLLAARNPDGGWGGSRGCPSSIEETALAAHALLAAGDGAEHTPDSGRGAEGLALGERRPTDADPAGPASPRRWPPSPRRVPNRECAPAAQTGLDWIARNVRNGQTCGPSPIGLYFAKLWYAERLYPLVFAVWALERARGAQDTGRTPDA